MDPRAVVRDVFVFSSGCGQARTSHQFCRAHHLDALPARAYRLQAGWVGERPREGPKAPEYTFAGVCPVLVYMQVVSHQALPLSSARIVRRATTDGSRSSDSRSTAPHMSS